MNFSLPVKKGKFQLHRNIEKEDEEERHPMAACIEALNSIQSLNPDGKRIIGTIIILKKNMNLVKLWNVSRIIYVNKLIHVH